jgi:hypothetical protein
MPVGSTKKTRWEDQVKTVYLLDPDTGEPMGGAVGGSSLPVSLKAWHYIGSDIITANGEQEVVLPADCTAFVIEARGGAVHYAINGVGCDTNDSYIAEDGMRSVGVMANLVSLWVYGADATTYAHVQFWREA